MTYDMFSKIMRYKREKRGYRQIDMANILSTSLSNYCRMENGLVEPSFSKLIIICKILNINFNDIIINSNEKDFLTCD